MSKNIRMQKSVLILLILLIVGFELYVFSKIFNPNVSLYYRLYYIDKKLATWPGHKGEGLIYERNTRLDHINISSNLSRAGWSHAEEKFRWSEGKNSELYLIFTNIDSYKGVLNLNLGTLGEQMIKLKINEHYQGSYTLESWDTNINFKFDKDVLIENEVNIIKFEFPNARKPGNGDPRVLAIALKSFKIE